MVRSVSFELEEVSRDPARIETNPGAPLNSTADSLEMHVRRGSFMTAQARMTSVGHMIAKMNKVFDRRIRSGRTVQIFSAAVARHSSRTRRLTALTQRQDGSKLSLITTPDATVFDSILDLLDYKKRASLC